MSLMHLSMSRIAHIRTRLKSKAFKLLTLVVTKLATHRCIGKVFKRSGSTILCCNICIKFGDSVTVSEANALRFVASHTSVPVPVVHHAFTYHGMAYILMERIRGETVAQRWDSLSDASKTSIFNQLKRMLQELRSIPCETNGVSNLDGGPIHDYRLRTSSWGPFCTIADFHFSLRNNITSKSLDLPNSLSPAVICDLKRIATFHDSVLDAPVLTHGDLSSLNILIRDDIVVGIIDWDTAGWLPYYWEYTEAWHANPQNEFWQNEVKNFLDEQEEELNIEKLRRMYFGDI